MLREVAEDSRLLKHLLPEDVPESCAKTTRFGVGTYTGDKITTRRAPTARSGNLDVLLRPPQTLTTTTHRRLVCDFFNRFQQR